LGADLRVPVIHRDRLRRAVFQAFVGNQGAHELIAEATGRMVIAILEMFALSGTPVVLDGNFNTPGHSNPVRAFVVSRHVPAVEVCLWGDPSTLRTRFIDRADPPLTEDLVPYFEKVLHRSHESVLPPPARVFHIDTTDFTTLENEYSSVLRAIRESSNP
jgi:predicted kinase